MYMMYLRNLFNKTLILHECKNKINVFGHQLGSPSRYSSSASSDFLKIESEGAVRILALNNPSRKNPVDPEKCILLAEAIKEADADPSVNIIGFTGKGEVFCSGMDLVAVKNASSAQEYASRGSSSFSQLFAAFIDCKKPIVALVNGPAVGLGVTILGLCDTAYSVDTATFAAPFTALGICLEGASSYSFPRIIGYSKASSLLVFNEKINATKAFEWGLVAEVIPKENFEKETRHKLHVMSELPIKSLLYSKELVRGRERCLLHAANEREREGLLEFLQCVEFTNNVKNFFARKKK